jgi:hypothetical protein
LTAEVLYFDIYLAGNMINPAIFSSSPDTKSWEALFLFYQCVWVWLGPEIPGLPIPG